MSIYQKVSKFAFNVMNEDEWQKITAKDLVDLPQTSKTDLRRIFDSLAESEYPPNGTILQSMLIDEIFDRNDPKLIAEIFCTICDARDINIEISNPQSNFYLVSQKIYELNCREAICIILRKNGGYGDYFLRFIDQYYPQERFRIIAEFEQTKTEIKQKNKKAKNRRQRNNDIKQLAKLIKKYPEELKKLSNGEKVEKLLD